MIEVLPLDGTISQLSLGIVKDDESTQRTAHQPRTPQDIEPMFDYLITFRRDSFTEREIVIADSDSEARMLFKREHPTLVIVSIKLITE